MGAKRDTERRSFEECRTIDVSNQRALKFWAKRLGVTAQEIAEVVQEVGANSTAVALKLEAPRPDGATSPSPLLG